MIPSMRRLMSIAAFALFLTVPLWAQRGGGGHGGFAGHAGGFGGHAAFGGAHGAGGHFSRGARGGAFSTHTFSRTSRPTNFRQPFLHDGFRTNRFRNGLGRFHGRRLRNCFGYGCWGYSYPWYGGYWDPSWWDSGSSYDEDYDRDRVLAAEMDQQSLDEQRMLRQEESDGDRDAYARPAPAQPPASRDQGTSIIPATVLVFRDQHKLEVQNYAIIGQTLWSFAPQRTDKIPLSQLDLIATVKANDDRGLTFRIPGHPLQQMQ